MGKLWPGENETLWPGEDGPQDDDDLLRGLAEQIGFVVMACAGLDHSVGALLSALAGVEGPVSQGWGLSGGRLVKRLREASNGEPVIDQVADSYQDIYERRNHVVHGLWHIDPDSLTDFLVGKPAALSRSSPDDHEFWAAMPWDIRELKLLHHETRGLIDQVARLTVVYLGDH